MRIVVTSALVLWALGVVFHEAIEQLAAAVVIGAALVAWRRGVTVDDDVRTFLRATAWLVGWCAVSPALAWGRGIVDGWPPSGRYGQLEDLVATGALAIVATVGVPWRALAWIVGVGWTGSFALGVYQHLYWFKPDLSWLTGQPEWRVHQSLDGRRFTAGGFLFHRLRFAHTALALVGPALASFVVMGPKLRRIGGALVLPVLLGTSYIAYARSALGVMLAIVALGVVWLGAPRIRLAGLVAVVVGGVVILGVGPLRDVFARAFESFDSDRGAAMRLAWSMVLEHPLVGVGFGNHALVAKTLAPAGSSWVVDHSAHNTWLQVWTETGLLGVGLFGWFHVTLARALWRRRTNVVASGALLSWVAFHAASMVHTLPMASGVMLAFAFVWGLGLAPGSVWTIVQESPKALENQAIQPPPTTSSPS